MRCELTRRTFIHTIGAVGAVPLWASTAVAAGRKLDFAIAGDFGEAEHADIRAVVLSAAEAIWKHCPNTTWEVPGFHIYRSEPYPITLDDHRADGRIAIGLAVHGTYWAQFAFQFAHEFGHALTGHSNDWRQLTIRGPRPNHWLEECLCETASLFALRAMGKIWATNPPYPNWKSFAPKLTDYAEQRMRETKAALPADHTFGDWFRAEEASLREQPTQRAKNNIVALQLLPLFEAEPAGWELLTSYNLGTPEPHRTLARQFDVWRTHAPAQQHAFLTRLARIFAH